MLGSIPHHSNGKEYKIGFRYWDTRWTDRLGSITQKALLLPIMVGTEESLIGAKTFGGFWHGVQDGVAIIGCNGRLKKL